jgi:hypothetical protein
MVNSEGRAETLHGMVSAAPLQTSEYENMYPANRLVIIAATISRA